MRWKSKEGDAKAASRGATQRPKQVLKQGGARRGIQQNRRAQQNLQGSWGPEPNSGLRGRPHVQHLRGR
eukprot:CAMPEP_0206556680 /NCGR_PEP_ID=MMETSP0325_2-20121206/18612_1 /ASSEMBLY_ACC=CAM_ASM_000347 /TAXON_ID=2866 /ORGANISM="Crypthecodinium cohnii, Strain Seligo" /LENGTH=68 /DNA_ID=CAMNT_0054057375 /DNA_START=190 /DNA_END=393 /DNA_ORIENTATION=+